jgi:hypothetical protein
MHLRSQACDVLQLVNTFIPFAVRENENDLNKLRRLCLRFKLLRMSVLIIYIPRHYGQIKIWDREEGS